METDPGSEVDGRSTSSVWIWKTPIEQPGMDAEVHILVTIRC